MWTCYLHPLQFNGQQEYSQQHQSTLQQHQSTLPQHQNILQQYQSTQHQHWSTLQQYLNTTALGAPSVAVEPVVEADLSFQI